MLCFVMTKEVEYLCLCTYKVIFVENSNAKFFININTLNEKHLVYLWRVKQLQLVVRNVNMLKFM